ncbi:uncharacterized protein [Littorina saxatilis]
MAPVVKIMVKWGTFNKQITLTEQQQSFLEKDDHLVILHGPPGTGKTSLLMLRGLKWLKAGKDVIVFARGDYSIPSSRLIYLQLSEAREASQGSLSPDDQTWGRVVYERVNILNAATLDSAMQAVKKQGDKDVHLIMDNIIAEGVSYYQELQQEFLTKLKDQIPGLHLWGADWVTTVPDGYTRHILNEPIRYHKGLVYDVNFSVLELCQVGVWPETHRYSRYTISPELCKLPEGPKVVHVNHKGKGQQDKWPVDSEECGHRVAELLRSIGVGGDGKASPAASNTTEQTSSGSYDYRDVLVITRSAVDKNSPPAFARGLEASGIPTNVFGRSGSYGTLEDSFDDTILGKENKVTVMNFKAAMGLDRKVVVCLIGVVGQDEAYELPKPEKKKRGEHHYPVTMMFSRDVAPGVQVTQSVTMTGKPLPKKERKAQESVLKNQMEIKQRLSIYSRCTDRLIVVHMPPGFEAGPHGPYYGAGGGQSKKCVIL